MIGYWISFTLIAILIPIGLESFKVWVEKHFNCTDEQKKNVSINVFKYWMFYWLCDLFYMACFLDNLICKFVFGCLIMVIVLMNVCFSFVSSNCKTTFQKIGLLQDFLVGIGLTVYLIYLIPEKELQTIILTIVAALYGGLITLVGVAWTIKKSDKDRKEDEIKHEKPYFSFNPQFNEIPLNGSEKACFPPIEGEYKHKSEVFVQLENSDKSPFILKKLYHDEKWFELEGNFTVLPSGKCFLSFYFDSPSNIVLTVQDTLENEYYYMLFVLKVALLNGAGLSSSGRFFYTLREIREISKDELSRLVKENKSKEENGNEK